MIKKRSLWVIPNENEISQERCPILRIQMRQGMRHDAELYSINQHYSLEIPFQEECNYMIDYGRAGYMVIFFLEEMILLSIPKILSFHQYTVLETLKEQVEENELYIYSFSEGKSSMEMIYKEEEESNATIMGKLLDKKEVIGREKIKESPSAPNTYQKH